MYNETLIEVLPVHNAHFLILSLKCIFNDTFDENCMMRNIGL